MTMIMRTNAYTSALDASSNRSTCARAGDVESETLVLVKAHNRSTRHHAANDPSTTVPGATTVESTESRAESEVGSRVAYYGARRKMKRQLIPMRIAVLFIFMLCLCFFIYGMVRNSISPSVDTVVESQDDHSSSSTYDVFTIEYNPDVETSSDSTE